MLPKFPRCLSPGAQTLSFQASDSLQAILQAKRAHICSQTPIHDSQVYQQLVDEATSKSGSENINLASFPENLISVVTTGIAVDVWAWPAEYDRDNHILWECERHEHENQNYRPHGIFQKIEIVLGVRSRVVGGDWQATTKRILDVLGPQARSRVSRWTRVPRRGHRHTPLFLQEFAIHATFSVSCVSPTLAVLDHSELGNSPR